MTKTRLCYRETIWEFPVKDVLYGKAFRPLGHLPSPKMYRRGLDIHERKRAGQMIKIFARVLLIGSLAVATNGCARPSTEWMTLEQPREGLEAALRLPKWMTGDELLRFVEGNTLFIRLRTNSSRRADLPSHFAVQFDKRPANAGDGTAFLTIGNYPYAQSAEGRWWRSNILICIAAEIIAPYCMRFRHPKSESLPGYRLGGLRSSPPPPAPFKFLESIDTNVVTLDLRAVWAPAGIIGLGPVRVSFPKSRDWQYMGVKNYPPQIAFVAGERGGHNTRLVILWGYHTRQFKSIDQGWAKRQLELRETYSRFGRTVSAGPVEVDRLRCLRSSGMVVKQESSVYIATQDCMMRRADRFIFSSVLIEEPRNGKLANFVARAETLFNGLSYPRD